MDKIFVNFVPSKKCRSFAEAVKNSKTSRGQTVHFVSFKRIPQQAKKRIVTELAALLFCFIFFVILDSTVK